MSWILAGIYIAVEIVALASAVHALFTVRTPQGTIAWVVGLIAFPWLGLPLYWFFGSRRFDAHSLAMQKILRRHESKIHEVHEGMSRFVVPREDVGRNDYESRPLLFKAGARAARLLAPIL